MAILLLSIPASFEATKQDYQTVTIHAYQAQITKKIPLLGSPTPYVYSREFLKGFAGEASINSQLDSKTYTELVSTLECESGFRYNAFNKQGNSYGVSQFIPATFKANCKGDYKDAKDQITCAVKMFKEGKQDQWDCYCAIHVGNKGCQKRGFK